MSFCHEVLLFESCDKAQWIAWFQILHKVRGEQPVSDELILQNGRIRHTDLAAAACGARAAVEVGAGVGLHPENQAQWGISEGATLLGSRSERHKVW